MKCWPHGIEDDNLENIFNKTREPTITEELDSKRKLEEDEVERNLRYARRASLEELAKIKLEKRELDKKEEKFREIIQETDAMLSPIISHGITDYARSIEDYFNRGINWIKNTIRSSFKQTKVNDVEDMVTIDNETRRDMWKKYVEEEMEDAKKYRKNLLEKTAPDKMGEAEILYQHAFGHLEKMWLEYLTKVDINERARHLRLISGQGGRAEIARKSLEISFSGSSEDAEKKVRDIYSQLFGYFDKEWQIFLDQQPDNKFDSSKK